MGVWSSKWPSEVGFFWFYGYVPKRVGFNGKVNKKSFQFVEVIITGNGKYVYLSKGNFLCEEQTEEAIFQKAVLPPLPKESE